MSDDSMLTFAQVLERLGLDKKALRELISSGVLKAYSEGGSFTFKEADIDNYVSQQQEGVPTVVLDDDLEDIDLDEIGLDDMPDLELSDEAEAIEVAASDESVDDVEDVDEDLSLDDEIDLDDLDLGDGSEADESLEENDSLDIDAIDVDELDDLEEEDVVEEASTDDADEVEEEEIDDITDDDLSDEDYDGLDIGGLDVDVEESSDTSNLEPNITLNEDNEIVGSDELDLSDVDLDDIGDDLSDDASATTLEEISLDEATGSDPDLAPVSAEGLGDTGMTEELDLGNDTLDLSDEKLFPDDTSVTGDVTADFDLDDAVTGEISFTDPIDVTEDLDADLPEDALVGAAAAVSRIQVKKEPDWIWMTIMFITLGVVTYSSIPVTALHKRDYVPEVLKSLVKDKNMAPKSGGLSSVKKADGSKFGKIATSIK